LDKTDGKQYNMDNQDMEYEFGVSTRININSLAKNVYTDKMYADLVDFCNLFTSMPTNTLDSIMAANSGPPDPMTEAQAKEILQTEQDQLRRVSQQRFNNLLGLLDSHSAVVMREQTDLGSRMSRLELIEARLEEDRINYKKLLSDNEDVDYTEAAMEMRLAETVYQAALQVGARIMQLSLADYIR
jgi:flagellar hook-associated protein 3 FlgL